MTPETFVERYKGREVRVNEKYGEYTLLHEGSRYSRHIGKVGTVVGVYGFEYICVSFNPRDADMKDGYRFKIDELDIIDNDPLPLPG